MATATEVALVVGELAAAYPSANITAITIKVYANDLADLPLDVLKAAAQKHRVGSKWFPSVAELREAAADLTTAPARSGDDAWGDVKRAIAEHGTYHPPDGAQYGDFRNYFWEFPDPIVGKLVKAMGWTYLCQSENEMADRAHFRKSYETEQQRAREQARLTPSLLEFQAEKRQALPAPAERREQALALMAGIGKGKA